MTSQGSPYSRFQRAIKTGNLNIIRSAALEVRTVPLSDALAICLVILERKPEAYERAALRWVARWVTEQSNASLEALGEVLDAFEELRHAPTAAAPVAALRELCR